MTAIYFIYHIQENNNGYGCNHVVIARSESEAVSVSHVEKQNIDSVEVIGVSDNQEARRITSESLWPHGIDQ